MGKRKAPARRSREEEEDTRREVRTKQRHEQGPATRGTVNPGFLSLFKNADRAKLFREKFHERDILEYKFVNYTELVKMHDKQNVDTADYIISHGWGDFIQVNRPVFHKLLRVLISNLDESTMISWIGGTQVDLSMDAWNRTFHLPPVSDEDEASVMGMSKEDLFFRLTGERNLGVAPFIKINQLHQEVNVRLTAQIVMNVLVPKKGSKEQIKIEEGRLLYALLYGKQINLAKMIVDRLKSALGRKSSPIGYGMHLTEIMAQAGVDLGCAGDSEVSFSSAIDHHTLKRLGYQLEVGNWIYARKRKKGPDEHDIDTEAEEEQTAQAESTDPFPPPLSRSTSVLTEIAHLRQFMVEQLHFIQASLMSKLETMDSRLQICESHILSNTRTAPTPTSSQDPKGKAPMVSPIPSPLTSPHTSPAPTPYISSPAPTPHIPSPPSPPPQKSPPPEPIPVESHSSSTSSTSSSSSSQQFTIAAHTSPAHSPSHHSSDSEATASDPLRYLTPPPSPVPQSSQSPPPTQPVASTTRMKQPATKNPSYTPSPPSPPPAPSHVTQPPPPPQPSSVPRPDPTPYRRRKLAVTRPSTSPPQPPQP